MGSERALLWGGGVLAPEHAPKQSAWKEGPVLSPLEPQLNIRLHAVRRAWIWFPSSVGRSLRWTLVKRR